MAESTQPTEGAAQVQYKVKLPKQAYLTFDPERVTFVESTISDSIYGSGSGKHVFTTLDPFFLSSLKGAMQNADPVIEFRLGFGDPMQMYWLPWQRHIITNYYSKFQGIGSTAGHEIVMETDNNLTRMKRPDKVLARKGTIADIVNAIAQENGLKAVVEPTKGIFLMIQNYIDDTRFISSRLMNRALNGKGRAGFYFFIRDNVLHFHTLDYQTSARQMNYYGAFGSDLATTDRSQLTHLWDSGLAGTRLTAYDPYTGQSKEIISDANNAVKLADSIYQYKNVISGTQSIFYHLGSNPVEELTALGQSMYERSRQQTFRTRMVLQKTISLRHGDLLNISITQENSNASDYSGFYFVANASHYVKKQQVTSVYTLERGEIAGTKGIAVQKPDGQLVPNVEAPGQIPNIIEAQSSDRTKGAGKQSSAKTFSVVADAQTGRS